MHRTSLLLALSLLSLVACNPLNISPEKACSRAEKLMSKAGDPIAKDKDRCVNELARLKKDDPTEYDCTAKCLGDNALVDQARACLLNCKPAAVSSAGKIDGEEEAFPVDALTPAALKGKVASAYQQLGFDIAGEKDTSDGWSATVSIGNKAAPRGEAHVYKVHLVDVKDRKAGFDSVASLKRANHIEESRVGKRKALVVRCVFQRSALESGKPRPCAAFDGKIASFTNDLAAGQ
jgi:hypothetical protein